MVQALKAWNILRTKSEPVNKQIKALAETAVKLDAIKLVASSDKQSEINNNASFLTNAPAMGWSRLVEATQRTNGQLVSNGQYARSLLALCFNLQDQPTSDDPHTKLSDLDPICSVKPISSKSKLAYTSCRLPANAIARLADALCDPEECAHEDEADYELLISTKFAELVPLQSQVALIFSDLISRNCHPRLSSDTYHHISRVGLSTKWNLAKLSKLYQS
jgi:hypothetical protein